MTEAPRTAEQHTLDSASAALGAGEAETLYRSGRAFTTTVERLRALSDEFRVRLRDLESAWHGPGSQSFVDTATRITHRVDELVSTLNEPGYEWLCREMGDALAKGQRELQQQRAERDELRATPASAQADRESPSREERAQQVMNELGNTYRQLGDQLRPVVESDSNVPQAEQAPSTSTAGASIAGGPGNEPGPRSTATADPLRAGGTGAALPAGGVLGRTPKAPAPPENAATEHAAAASSGTLGRAPASHTPGTTTAAPMGGPLPLTAGALGRSERTRQRDHAPTERAAPIANGQSGVLGGNTRSASRRTPEQPQDADSAPRAGNEAESARAKPHTESESERPALPETQHAATEAVAARPATTSAPSVDSHAPQPGPSAQSAAAQPAAAHASPAPSYDAADPLPPGVHRPSTGVDLASTATATPPQQVHTPGTDVPPPDPSATQQGSQTAAQGQGQGAGGGFPPPHGGGMGGTGASSGAGGGERERNTWLAERSDTWQHEGWSGVLGR